MDQLEKFKNMTPEEAQAFLDAFAAEGGCGGNCSACQSECGSRVEKPARTVISLLSGKGGTGNSVMTAMLACAFAKQGLRVGILDADISSASIAHMFGLSGKMAKTDGKYIPEKTASGIEIVSDALTGRDNREPVIYPASDKTKLAAEFWLGAEWSDGLDLLLIDLPKASDDTTLEFFTTMPIDAMIAISNPGKLALDMASRVINLGHMLMMPILGVIENFADADSEVSFVQRFGSGLALLSSVPYSADIRALAESGSIENASCDELNFFAQAISEELKQK